MKKLRMIVTSVIVLAIVGSAFSYKAKLANFCVNDGTSSTTCVTTILQDQEIVSAPAGVAYKYFAGWTGSASTCGNTTNCTTNVRLRGN